VYALGADGASQAIIVSNSTFFDLSGVANLGDFNIRIPPKAFPNYQSSQYA
jgi:hypothetical protein